MKTGDETFSILFLAKELRKLKKVFTLMKIGLLGAVLFGGYHFITTGSLPNPLAVVAQGNAQTASSSGKLISRDFAETANKVLPQAGPPLLLQTDERWGDISYGTESENNDLAHNGCAIASLAMIASYWQGQTVTPPEILDWAQNNYYVTGQGTSWQIFSDFAPQYGLQVQSLASIEQAEEWMQTGHPVIVSVNPGTFTKTGHIMVLAMNEGKLTVYDPNDDSHKQHYQTDFSEDIFRNEAVSYWVFYK
ncbi:hypothetical protein RU97_GL001045 [Enterococcus canis]|uniref:Peptidase C39 domain-containing protein n=2 Tax=Enterococcus canis TaxID=214095 RepID=A0A1L8RID3_9ENTE|nr:hypothetical protein RU97_GL001045 [Enterococcus canis]